MKISIIIPVYNCVNYLTDCIESIIAQTVQDFEIIMIDDGSTDGSEKVCDRYADSDKRFSVIHQKNQGVSVARNAGLRKAKGDFISFIDADDTLDRDMYELLLSYAEQYADAGIVHCGYKRVEDGVITPIHDTKQVVVQTSEEAIRCLLAGKLFVGGLWNKLFRRSEVKNLYFAESLKINEDILYNFEAFNLAQKSVFVDYAKYNYMVRKDTSACIRTSNLKKASDSCEVNRYFFEQLSGTALSKIARDRYLRALSGCYRVCSNQKVYKNKCNEIKTTMWSVFRSGEVGKAMLVTTVMIRFCPIMYRKLYSIYDKVRKPMWDV